MAPAASLHLSRLQFSIGIVRIEQHTDFLLHNRAFVGLNIATVMLYAGLSVMFFLLPFDLIDRRCLSSTGAALTFLPFTLGLALLSPVFGSLADAIGPRVLLITGPVGAALSYI